MAATGSPRLELGKKQRKLCKETESCDGGGDDQHVEDSRSATWRSEMDEWEEELEANIELERRELGQSPPEDHEDWADD